MRWFQGVATQTSSSLVGSYPNPDSSAGNFRWVIPPSVEWEALNIDRIAHVYSCDTLLMCLVRLDLATQDQSDLNLRERLMNGISVIKQILHEVTWSSLSVKFTDDQISALKAVETENFDIWSRRRTHF